MDIIVIIVSALITVVILGSPKIDKASIKLMLLGIEVTIIGIVIILISNFINSSIVLYLAGVALIVNGFIVNLFGFIRE